MKRGYRAAAPCIEPSTRGVWPGHIHARARRCGGSASAGVCVIPGATHETRSARHLITTTTKSWPSASTIAWPAVLWIGGLHVGALLAFVPACFTWPAVAVCLFLYWLTGGIGICMTYHRLLTHRSFALRPRWLEYVFTAIGCCASEGGAIGWVADHRKHHAHADDEQDVHSPSRGFAWAHMLWWMTPDVTSRPPRNTTRSGRPTSPPSTAASTVSTSSSPSCCSWPSTRRAACPG